MAKILNFKCPICGDYVKRGSWVWGPELEQEPAHKECVLQESDYHWNLCEEFM